MKYSIVHASLVSALVLGLSACGGGGGGDPVIVHKFDGKWAGKCEDITTSRGARSFKQSWDVDGNKLINTIKAWGVGSSGCPADVTPDNAIAEATIVYDSEEIGVSGGICESGKAQGVEIVLTKVSGNNQLVTGNDSDIRAILKSKGVELPKHNIVCKGADKNLYAGLITADKDGSTKTKRPVAIDPQPSFFPVAQ